MNPPYVEPAAEAFCDLAARGGRPGRELAAAVDLLRAAGVRPSLTRARQRRQLKLMTGPIRDSLYHAIWAEAAERIGAELSDLGHGWLELRSRGTTKRVRQQWVPLDHPEAVALSFDKRRVHELLAAAGLRVPAHLELNLRDIADAFAMLSGGPVVVKPPRGTGGGAGITGGVCTRGDLITAARRAARRTGRVLVERQLDGPVFRLLFLDGELLDTVHCLPPSVSADGESTVGALIRCENAHRLRSQGWAGLTIVTTTLDTVLTLQRAGLKLSSVPAAGRTAVKSTTNERGVADACAWRELISAEVVEAARRAVEIVGLRLAGVDIVARSVEGSVELNGGGILEVNAGPGIHHHYLVSNDHERADVAVPLLERLMR